MRLIQAALHLAREELIVTTPYFVPDEGTFDALLTAAERGVRTVLVVPKRNDSWLVGAAGPLHDGLGLLPGSACPHYDGEPARRPAFRRLVDAGELPPGHAADDGAALVFSGRELQEVVASRDLWMKRKATT